MFPRVVQIFDKVKHEKARFQWLGRGNEVIKAAKILKKDQTTFDPEILYIGRFSDLGDGIDAISEGNLICVEDTEAVLPVIESGELNLLLFEFSVSIEDIFNEVQDILLDSTYIMRSSASLLNSIIQGRGLQYIIKIGSELLGNPIMLGDSNFRILAYSQCDDVDDSAWIELRDTGYCTFEYTLKYDFKKLIEACTSSPEPIIGDLGQDNRTKRILAKIEVDGAIVAHLAVLEHRRLFTNKDIEMVSFLCDIISSEMQRNNRYLNIRNVLIENLIISLLGQECLNQDSVQERIKYLKWKQPKKIYLLAVKYNSYEDTFALIPYIRDSLKCLKEDSTIVFYDNHLILVIGCPEHEYLDKKDFFEFNEFLRLNRLIAGISQAFSEIMDIRKYYEQALISMQLGQRMGKEEILFDYKDYAVYHMLDICCKHYDIREFCHPALKMLLEYDSQHKTEHMKSLMAYIINLRNLGVAAEALYVHRNTMSYRLTKIKEITGLNLEDEDLNFHIYVSYKLLEYSGKL